MTQGSSQFRDINHKKEVPPDDSSDKTTSSRKSIPSEALMKATRTVIKDRDRRNSTDSTQQSDSEQSSISKFYHRRDSNSASESSSASENGSERSFHEQTNNETEELQQLLAHAKDDFHNSVVYMRTQSDLRQARDDFKASEAYQIPEQAVREARKQFKESKNAYQDAQKTLEQFESDQSKIPREALEQAVEQFENSDAYRIPKQSAKQYIDDFYNSEDPQRRSEYKSYLATLKELQKKADKVEENFYQSDKYKLLKRNLEDTEARIGDTKDYQIKLKAVHEAHTQLIDAKKEYRKTQKVLEQAVENFNTSEAYQIPEQAAKEARTQLKNSITAIWKIQKAQSEAREQFKETDTYKNAKRSLDDANKQFERTADYENFKEYKENTLQLAFHRERGMPAGNNFGTLEDLKHIETAMEEDRREFKPYKIAEKKLKEVEDNFYASNIHKNLEYALDQALEEYNTYVKPPNGWEA